MAGNIYDDVLEDLEENQQPEPQDPFEAAVARIHEGRQTRLRASMLQKDEIAPDQAAEARKLAIETGLPQRLVEQNLDAVRKEAEQGRTPYEKMFAETPALAEWASIPDNLKVASDDMEQLGAIEWLLTAPQRAFARGVNQVRAGRLASESIFRELTQEERDLLSSYEAGMEEGGQLGGRNSWFKRAITGGSQQLPNLFGAGLYAAEYAAVGAAATGAIGAAVGAPTGVGVIPGALTGAGIGARAGAIYGGARFGFELEAGLAYREFLGFRDETGQTLDPTVAKMAAIATGTLNAGLEVVGLEALARTIPGIDKLSSAGARAAVKRALRQPSIRAALTEAAATYGRGLSIETATEVAQRAITIMSGELAKASEQLADVPGMVERGNINLYQQPKVANEDGSVSTVSSFSTNIDGKEVLLPTITADGRKLTEAQALEEYRKTGRHLGKFNTPAEANEFAKRVHESYEAGVFDGSGFRKTGGQIANELIDEGLGAIEAFAFTLAGGPALRVARENRRVREGEQAKQFFEALGSQTAASATVKRMPQAAQDFIARATENGPVATIYAPADTWVQYWQSQNVDPAAIAADILGSPDALEKALATGEDLAIPTARYATTLAPTSHNAFFANELRLAPDEMNGREAAEFREQQKQLADQAAKEAEFEAATPIRDTVLEQLLATGMDRQAAEAQADLYESVIGNVAERAGVDPVTLFEQYGLKIQRPAVQDAQAAPGATPAAEAGIVQGRLDVTAGTPPVPPGGDGAGDAAGGVTGAGGEGGVPVVDEEAEAAAAADEAAGDQLPALQAAGTGDLTDGTTVNEATPNVRVEGDGTAQVDALPGVVDTQGATDGEAQQGADARAGQGGDAGATGVPPGAQGVAAAEPLEPYANEQRAADYAATLEHARSLNPAVDERRFRELFDFYLDIYDEARSEEQASNPKVLLREIAKRGGIYESERGQAGEMRWLREGRAFGNVAGVGGVLATKPRRLTNVRKKVDGKWEIRQEHRGGLGLDEMVASLREDPRFYWLEDEAQLVDWLDDLIRHGIPEQASTTPDAAVLEEIAQRVVKDLEDGVSMLNADEMEADILEPDGPVDTSFNVAEFGQGLFDEEPGPVVDMTEAGAQPRLPGDVGAVRDEERQLKPVSDQEQEFKLTSEVADRGPGVQRELFQSAWHGSPHVFEEFSLHAIGSGEGQQVYGWGLYFASKRGIAEHYRTALTSGSQKRVTLASGDNIEWNEFRERGAAEAAAAGMSQSLVRELIGGALSSIETEGAVTQRLLDNYRGGNRETLAGVAHAVVNGTATAEEVAEFKESYGDQWMEAARDKVARLMFVADLVEREQPTISPPGRLFHVDVPESDVMLDWDRPASQQPPKVQEALRALGVEWTAFKPRTLASWDRYTNSVAFAKLWVEDIGIRQTLREGENLARLAKVDPEALRQFNEWQAKHQGLVRAEGMVDPTGARIYQDLQSKWWRDNRGATARDAAEGASRALMSVGVPALRYLDGTSRSRGEGTHNFVVFDDKLVQVREFFQSAVQEQEGQQLEQADLEEFQRRAFERFGEDLARLKMTLGEAGEIQLEEIAVRRGAARAGIGSRVMQAVTRFADMHQAPIVLNVAEHGWGSIDRGEAGQDMTVTESGRMLERFYARFGFTMTRPGDEFGMWNMQRQPTARIAQLGQPLYHGTPHNFDRFSTEKIGTGEGAAAYGWGLYFAEDPAIAAHYFDTLSDDPQILDLRIGSMRLNPRNNFDYSSRAHVSDLENIRASFAEDILIDQLEMLAVGEKGFQAWALEKLDAKIRDYYTEEWPEGVEAAKQLRAELAKPGALSVKWDAKSGGVYQVEIADEHIGKMLDWDAPIKDQPKPVQDLVREALKEQGYLRPNDNGPRQLTAAFKAWTNDHGSMVDGPTGQSAYHIISGAASKPEIDRLQAERQRLVATEPFDAKATVAIDLQIENARAKGAEQASKRLLAAGVPGLKYKDANSRDDTRKKINRNVVVFDDSIVELTHKNGERVTPAQRREYFQQQRPKPEAPERRGSIRFGPGKQVQINLFEKADLTTFLHESGHLFLEIMGDLVEKVQATPEGERTEQQQKLVADYATLLEWFGVEDRFAIGVDQHEQFARTFEAYLMEGKAPSVTLQSAFSRFRAWLLGVYRSVKNLGVQFTPEVRAVMDRLVATDLAIQRAEQDRAVPAMFLTPEAAGMTEREFGLYRDTIARASAAARDAIDRRLMGEVQREQTRQWKERRAEIEARVTNEVDQEPGYRALAAMQRGTQPNGDPLVEGLETEPLKLSKRILVARYGADYLKRLPRPYIYAAEGGLDPNVVAGMFGFSSGEAMLKTLEDLPPRRQVIESRTEKAMLAEHGSLLLDGQLMDVARGAIANEEREAVIRAEMRALAQLRRVAKPFQRQAAEDLEAERAERAYERRWMDAEKQLEVAIARGEQQVIIDELREEVMNLRRKARGGAATVNAAIPKDADIRAAAKQRLAGMKIRAIKPDVFWNAARRAGQQALERAARQDLDGAIEAKRRELLNIALYRQAQLVLEDVEKRVKRAKDLALPSRRASIGLAGHNYLDQIDGILDRFEFARVSNKVLDRRASLIKFLEGLESAGLPTDMPEIVVDEALRRNYRELTVEELLGVTDGLFQLEHLARLKNRLLKAQERRELDQLAADLADSIRQHAGGRRASDQARDRGLSSERLRLVQDFIASHRKIASIARELDGFEDGGPMWDAIIRPLNDAGNREAEMNAAATSAFKALVDKAFPNGSDLSRLYVREQVPSVGRSMSKMERLMVALNWGNEGNRDRLRKAERWTDEQVAGILGTLTQADFEFVQGVLDLINGYWTEIAAKQERVYGIAPEKVEATPIRTPFGEFAGGYFPLKYDDRLSAKASALLDVETAGLARTAAYAQATTKRGHTKARVEGVKLPVRLDFGVMFEHVKQVIHDLSHHEALIDVGRVLGHPAVQAAIYETHGDIVYRQLKNGVRDVAFGDIPATSAFERVINHIRAGATIAGLGWNVTTAFLQPIGLTQSMVRIGAGPVARGLTRWLRDAASMENTAQWITARSTFMRERARTQQREINEIRNQVGVNTGKFSGWVDDVLKTLTVGTVTKQGMADSYFYLIQQMQRVVDIPTWLGAYEKAIDAGESEDRAVALADQAVLDSQGGGQLKDLAAVQRGGPLMRLWTNFYSFFNTTYNLTVESTRRTNWRKPGDIGRLMVDYLMLYTIPAAAGFALREALSGDGEDEDVEDLIIRAVRAQASYLMGTMMLSREFSGIIGGGFGYEGPAGARALTSAARLMKQAEQGEVDPAFWRALNDTAGAVFHYPAGQVKRTVDGAAALFEGTSSNPLVLITGAK